MSGSDLLAQHWVYPDPTSVKLLVTGEQQQGSKTIISAYKVNGPNLYILPEDNIVWVFNDLQLQHKKVNDPH